MRSLVPGSLSTPDRGRAVTEMCDEDPHSLDALKKREKRKEISAQINRLLPTHRILTSLSSRVYAVS